MGDDSRAAAVTRYLRLACALLTAGCVALSLYRYRGGTAWGTPWGWLGAALLFAVLWQWRLPVAGTAADTPPPERPPWWRIAVGLLIAAGGAALWYDAIRALQAAWLQNFDRGWLSLAAAAVILSVGLDLAWARWPGRPGSRPELLRATMVLVLLVALAALYRLGNLSEFPGPYGVTQVEELQTGMWGTSFLHGGRLRWEYLSWQWLAALGITLGGPTLNAMRIPFAAVSVLKAVPLFFWLRFAVGTGAAVVATALFAVSTYDIVLSRIPNNQNALVVATAFALLAGPARRGRPSAYVLMGLFGGYVLYEYVAYRPLLLFVAAGAVWLSFRDPYVGWLRRAVRPLITIALIVSMGVPLFLGIMPPERFSIDYMNGWNRARAIAPYYDATDTWQESIDKRLERAETVAGLFFFYGEPAPAKRVEMSLVDPVTATLLVIGVGFVLTHLGQPVVALTLLAFIATLTGTLVITGNLDVGRAGGTVPYLYALVGYGAAALIALAQRFAPALRLALLASIGIAVGASVWLNTRALLGFWDSIEVKRAQRSNLALLSTWVRTNVGEGERIVGVAPGYFNVLEPNDAGWLRGRDIPGLLAWDIDSALQYWLEKKGPAVLVAFAAESTPAVKEYLEWLIPGLSMQYQPDPIGAGGQLAWARLEAPPPNLAARMTAARCYGVAAEHETKGPTAPLRVSGVVPLIDACTWPGDLRIAIDRADPPPASVESRYRARANVAQTGDYSFAAQGYPGGVELRIDGALHHGHVPIHLEAGVHEFDVKAVLQPAASVITVRLFWAKAGEPAQLVPFYRMVTPDPSCLTQAAQAAPS